MDKQFRTAEELADWLESLRETTPDGAITNTPWEPAQRAARAVREAGAEGVVLAPREPTAAMLQAGVSSIRCDVDPMHKPNHTTARRAARNAYVSMLAALPGADAMSENMREKLRELRAEMDAVSASPGMPKLRRWKAKIDAILAEQPVGEAEIAAELAARQQPMGREFDGLLSRNLPDFLDGTPAPTADKAGVDDAAVLQRHVVTKFRDGSVQVQDITAAPQQPPPVGVTDAIRGVITLLRQREPDNGEKYTEHDEGYEQASSEIANMLERILTSHQQPAPSVEAAASEGEVQDRIAKAIADVIGHGMAEKCEPHARAVIDVIGGVPDSGQGDVQRLVEANALLAEVSRSGWGRNTMFDIAKKTPLLERIDGYLARQQPASGENNG